MNLLVLFSHQVVLLGTLYHGSQSENSDNIQMNISAVHVTAGVVGQKTAKFDKQVLIKLSEDQDEYFFSDEQLAAIIGQTFTSEDVEIRSVFNRTLNFTLVTADKNLTLYCQFSTNKDLQLFFSQIRKTLPLQGSVSISIYKSIFFPADGDATPIANNSLFYVKRIKKFREVRAINSYNVVRMYAKRDEATGSIIQTQEADLVFLSHTFNITDLIGDDKVGLCLASIPQNSLIILRFPDRGCAWLFSQTVKSEINDMISCSVSDDWVAERRQLIDAPEPFDLPQLPYIGRELFR